MTFTSPRSQSPPAIAILVLVLPLLLAAAPSPLRAADGASLVVDLNHAEVNGNGVTSSFERYWGHPQYAEFDYELFFAATSPRYGTELWRSDGTAAGTRLVRDLCPGSCSSEPTDPIAFAGRLYFIADDGVYGNELWSTDGTADGTTLVRDVCPGPCSGVRPGETVHEVFNGRLYFIADDGRSGRELWSTDGTREGTRLEADLCPGSCTRRPHLMRATYRHLFFTTTQPEPALWSFDGMAAGPSKVVEQCGSSLCRPVRTLRGRLLFTNDDPVNGNELWASDGTAAGTHLLADLCPGSCSGISYYNLYSTHHSTYHQSQLYFIGSDAEDRHGLLFRTDGTTAGTELVLGGSQSGHRYITSVVTYRDRLYFIGYDPDSWPSRGLFRSDGTAAGTTPVQEILWQRGVELLDAGSRLFFRVDLHQLWASDGTAAGTGVVATAPEDHWWLGSLVRAGGRAFFPAAGYGTGWELWTSDGTPDGTGLVLDVHREVGSSEPVHLTPFGDAVLFSADDDADFPGIWRTDGTAAGTWVVGGPEDADGFYLDGEELLFSASWSTSGGLWRTDGTPEGTAMIAPYLTAARHFTPVGEVLFMSADGGDGEELWITDRTPEGTRQVKDIYPGLTGVDPLSPPASSYPHDLHAVSSGVLFAAENYEAGHELWWSDGTEDGTAVFKDLCPGTCSSSPADVVRFGDRFYFAATDADGDRELWSSDGTPEGTERFLDLVPGAANSAPHHLTLWQDRIFFFARGSTDGEALWTSDGTAAGTQQVQDLALAGLPSFVVETERLADRLFFVAANESTGPELWVTLGTAETTALVRDVRPGAHGAYPRSLTAVDGVVVFSADDGEHGHEPWRSDGTAEGTRLVADAVAGATSSFPVGFAAAPEYLLFQADDPGSGRELWALDRTLVNPGFVGPADLTLAATAVPDPVTAGEPVTYTVTVGNRGPWAAAQVVVTAVLAAGAAAVETRGCAEDPDGAAGCTLGTLAAGAERQFTLTVTAPIVGDGFATTFSVGSAAPDPEPGDNGAGVVTAIVPAEVLTLLDGRFDLRVRWYNQHGGTRGVGWAVPHSQSTGFFWFFDPENIELIVKVLDGGAINGRFWVFYGALSDVEYELTVTDTVTGAEKSYLNPPGTLCGRGDVNAFPRAGASLRPAAGAEGGDGGCGAEVLCLHGGRFRVEVSWRNQHAGGSEGVGRAVAGTEETGFFWFFSPDNLELAVKVLDGRALTGHFWVFYGGLSDVEYEITVTDTVTGKQKSYRNPPGQICGGADVRAL